MERSYDDFHGDGMTAMANLYIQLFGMRSRSGLTFCNRTIILWSISKTEGCHGDLGTTLAGSTTWA